MFKAVSAFGDPSKKRQLKMTGKMVRFLLVPNVSVFTKYSWRSPRLSPIPEEFESPTQWVGSNDGSMSPLCLDTPSTTVFMPSPLVQASMGSVTAPSSLDFSTGVGFTLRINTPPDPPAKTYETPYDKSPLSPESTRSIRVMRKEERELRQAAIVAAQGDHLKKD